MQLDMIHVPDIAWHAYKSTTSQNHKFAVSQVPNRGEAYIMLMAIVGMLGLIL